MRRAVRTQLTSITIANARALHLHASMRLVPSVYLSSIDDRVTHARDVIVAHQCVVEPHYLINIAAYRLHRCAYVCSPIYHVASIRRSPVHSFAVSSRKLQVSEIRTSLEERRLHGPHLSTPTSKRQRIDLIATLDGFLPASLQITSICLRDHNPTSPPGNTRGTMSLTCHDVLWSAGSDGRYAKFMSALVTPRSSQPRYLPFLVQHLRIHTTHPRSAHLACELWEVAVCTAPARSQVVCPRPIRHSPLRLPQS
ncbi:hypothetical protein C8Q80DRAFT_783091 [Daedaleopsis nitida]|nr:hypothetical protein C8Q80DRAFT_783091 [Daedaleopsis nitida]